MDIAFEILTIAALLGGVDVLYFHIYKFRLYENPASVAEEVTHLIRGFVFVAIVTILFFSGGTPLALWILWGLVAIDLINNVVDVWLERNSRASMGGLPSLEYVIHIVATFLTGLAVASVWWNSSAQGFVPVSHSTFNTLRVVGMIGFGSLMFLLESALFLKALHKRRAY